MTGTEPRPTTLGLAPSFGFGDRIGLATRGHVAAMKRAGRGIEPIFVQQSIREMARTGRSPEQVMHDALRGMQAASWTGRTGADADHLKTQEDVDATVAAGFTFFTIDPSDLVDEKADAYDEATLRETFASVREDAPWYEQYLGSTEKLPSGTQIAFDEAACMRCAVKYGRALRAALSLGEYIRASHEELGRPFEIELSVDETDQPTTLAEHYIVAEQCFAHDLRLVSLAPRYIGDFEKGVDYKGDVAALERSLADHAAIAARLGPYKLSLHSGSDKLSMYPALAQATGRQFHVKTAGTSYLEALRVVARHAEPLFRRIIDFARGRFERDKATYHISATLDRVPPPSEITDAIKLEQIYLERWDNVRQGRGFTEPGRQILHCTFGSVLTDEQLGPEVRSVLESHQDTYTEVLADHFSRHLEALQ